MTAYSATTTIQLDPTCYPKSVFLRWLTPNAAWDGWLFAGDKDEDAIEGANTFYRPAHARLDKVLSKTVSDALTLRTGNLTDTQARALRYIQSAPAVQMKLADGSFQEVKVTSYNDKIISGKEKRSAVTLQVETAIRATQTN